MSAQLSAWFLLFGTVVLLADTRFTRAEREEGIGFVRKNAYVGWAALVVSALCALVAGYQ